MACWLHGRNEKYVQNFSWETLMSYVWGQRGQVHTEFFCWGNMKAREKLAGNVNVALQVIGWGKGV
jgi:hypothetical protein